MRQLAHSFEPSPGPDFFSPLADHLLDELVDLLVGHQLLGPGQHLAAPSLQSRHCPAPR